MFSSRIIGKIDNVTVDGTSQESSNVNLILSQNEDTENLLNFNLETKPLDGECHTRVSIESRPLQIIYDAVRLWGHTLYKLYWAVTWKGYVRYENVDLMFKRFNTLYIRLSFAKNIRSGTRLIYDKLQRTLYSIFYICTFNQKAS